MPRSYSEDLRWRGIWMKEVLGYGVNEVAATLSMSPRTVERYVRKFSNFGEVKPEVVGRPLNSVSMYPYVEFLIMEAVLGHPDRTLAEIAHDVYVQTGCQYTLASLFYYLRRNRFSRKKLCHIFFRPLRCHVMQIDKI